MLPVVSFDTTGVTLSFVGTSVTFGFVLVTLDEETTEVTFMEVPFDVTGVTGAGVVFVTIRDETGVTDVTLRVVLDVTGVKSLITVVSGVITAVLDVSAILFSSIDVTV